MTKLSRKIKTGYKIVYKLHPFEFDTWFEDYPWLAESNIEIVGLKGKNLYQLFAESEIQVGVYSTALFEGLSFGVRTFILDEKGIEYMQYLIENENATIVSNVQDFLKKLPERQDTKINSDFFLGPIIFPYPSLLHLPIIVLNPLSCIG